MGHVPMWLTINPYPFNQVHWCNALLLWCFWLGFLSDSKGLTGLGFMIGSSRSAICDHPFHSEVSHDSLWKFVWLHNHEQELTLCRADKLNLED